MLSRKMTVGALALALAASTLAACSSGSSSSSGGGGSSGGSSGGSGSGASAAAAKIAPYLKPPTSIGITTPLSKKPATGKRVVILQSAEPVTVKTDDGFRAAGKVLGWDMITVQKGSGPEDPSKALSQAIDMHPDAINTTGTPLTTMAAQVARAKAAGIILLNDDTDDPIGQDGSVYTISLDSPTQTGLWGKMTGDYIGSKGGKDVLVVDLSIYPILHAYSEAVQSELKTVSPSTKVTIQDSQITDLINGKIPSNIVSAVQRDPNIDWVVLSLGDMATGLDAALRSAGAKVKIAGESASTANITALKNKTQDAWTGFAATIHGWVRIDALARIFNGDSLKPNDDASLPTQLLTQDNVASAPLDSDGYYLAVPDYQDQFKKLWHVS